MFIPGGLCLDRRVGVESQWPTIYPVKWIFILIDSYSGLNKGLYFTFKYWSDNVSVSLRKILPSIKTDLIGFIWVFYTIFKLFTPIRA